MLFLCIAIGTLAVLWTSVLALRAMPPRKGSQLQLLVEKHNMLSESLVEFTDKLPRSTQCSPPCDHPASEEFWSAFKVGNEQALEVAESAMAGDMENPECRLLLAMALESKEHFGAANEQLAAAKQLGATGSFLLHVESSLEIAEYLHNFSAPSPATSLPQSPVSRVEMLAIELHARMENAADGTELWLPGNNMQVAKDEVESFVVAHFTRYYAILTDMLKSLQSVPYNDGIYFVARLAVASGFPKEGYALYDALEGTMDSSHLVRNYKQELAMLRGQSDWKYQSSAASGGRTHLKVLN